MITAASFRPRWLSDKSVPGGGSPNGLWDILSRRKYERINFEAVDWTFKRAHENYKRQALWPLVLGNQRNRSLSFLPAYPHLLPRPAPSGIVILRRIGEHTLVCQVGRSWTAPCTSSGEEGRAKVPPVHAPSLQCAGYALDASRGRDLFSV